MIVLITGASGGLGPVLARTLVKEGLTVYGTSRNPTADCPCTMLPMEITSDTSVRACIDEVIAREGRIDVVVNCINRMLIGSVEEASMEEIETLYQTGVLGAMRVCKAVIPQLKKQGGGTIVNMSSMGGLLSVPLMSTYTSAKSALETFSEALYLELQDENIDVVVMQPVAMQLDRPVTGSHLQMAALMSDDSPSRRLLQRMANDTAASKLTPEMVSEKIYQVITAHKKPFLVPMDRARVLGVAKRLLPRKALHRMVSNLVYGG